MQRYIRQSIKLKNFFRQQDSLYGKLRSIFQKNPQQKADPFIANRSEQEYQYPLDKLSDQGPQKKKLTYTYMDDIESFKETQEQISDLEKLRMQNIDKVLGTNTHFHDIKHYEERLDSEHTMERQIIKRNIKQKETKFQQYLDEDPQKEVPPPKIRNFQAWCNKIQEQRTIPKHPVILETVKTSFESYQDGFNYLNLNQLSPQELKTSIERNQQREYESQVYRMIAEENLFTDFSLVSNSFISDVIQREYHQKLDVYNTLPIYYDKYIYYTKDPKLENSRNLYRVSAQQFKDRPIDITQIFEGEEIVIDDKETLQFLENFEKNKLVEIIVNRIVDKDSTLQYQSIFFDKNHEFCAFLFDVFDNEEDFVLIIKDIKNKTYFPQIITEVSDSIAFDQFKNIYFVRKNTETGVSNQVLMFNLYSDQLPVSVFQESKPGFSISCKQFQNQTLFYTVKQSLSEDIIFLQSRLPGSVGNQIYYKETYFKSGFKEFEKFQEKLNFRVQSGSDSFFYTKSPDQYPKQLFRKQFLDRTKQLLIQEQKEKSPALANLEELKRTIKSLDKTEFQKIHQLIELQEKSEIFVDKFDEEFLFECAPNEFIKQFIVLQHYIVIHLQLKNEEYFKFFNLRNQQFHVLKFKELLYSLECETHQQYSSSYFYFSYIQPHLPVQIMKYNIPMREYQSQHYQSYANHNPLDYAIERIEINSRDNTPIHMTLIYNRRFVGQEGPVILDIEQHYQEQTERKLEPEKISLMDRGFVFAYPHVRGTVGQGDEFFEQGTQDKRKNNINDLTDIAQFIRSSGISSRVIGRGIGELGCNSLLNSFMDDQNAYNCIVLHNGVYDLIDYLYFSHQSEIKYKIFGNIKENEQYYYLKSISPYHRLQNFLKDNVSLQNIFMTCDHSHQEAFQSRKLIARIRSQLESNSDGIFFKEYTDNQNLLEKISLETSYIINCAFYKMKK